MKTNKQTNEFGHNRNRCKDVISTISSIAHRRLEKVTLYVIIYAFIID